MLKQRREQIFTEVTQTNQQQLQTHLRDINQLQGFTSGA